MKLALAVVALALPLAVPCLAATHKRAAPEHSSTPADAFLGMALLCQGGASSNSACTVVKIEPPDGVSLTTCTAAVSAGAKHMADVAAQHGQHVTIAGVRCLSMDELRHMLVAPVASAAPQSEAPPSASSAPAQPPAEATPPDDDTIHGSTDGWRHV